MSDRSNAKPFPEKRRALRAPVPVDVVLRCPDKSGKSFIEKTRTVDISRTGAKTLIEHEVSHGARLQMAVPHRKRKSWATVARIGNKSGNQHEIGIALDDTTDFWGVRMPEEARAPVDAGTVRKQGIRMNGSAKPSESSLSVALAEELLASAKHQSSAVTEEDASAMQERVRSAIEQYAADALQSLNEQAAVIMKNLGELITEQTEEHLRRSIAAAVEQVEAAVQDVTKRNQTVWEEQIRSLTDAAQEQLQARLTEHEATLAASAVKARRDLARKLANLSSAVAED
jgi:PilZ domain